MGKHENIVGRYSNAFGLAKDYNFSGSSPAMAEWSAESYGQIAATYLSTSASWSRMGYPVAATISLTFATNAAVIAWGFARRASELTEVNS